MTGNFLKIKEYDSQDRLSKKQLEEYGGLVDAVRANRAVNLSAILNNTGLKECGLELLTKIFGWSDKIVSKLIENNVLTLGQLLDLDREKYSHFYRLGEKHWKTIVDYKNSVIVRVLDETSPYLYHAGGLIFPNSDYRIVDDIPIIPIEKTEENPAHRCSAGFEGLPISKVLINDVIDKINEKYPKLFNPILKNGFIYLIDLFDKKAKDLKGIGKNRVSLYDDLLYDIENNQEEWVDYILKQTEYNKTRVFPENFELEDEMTPVDLYSRLDKAIRDLIRDVESNTNAAVFKNFEIAKKRYCENLSLSEIASQLNLNRETVRIQLRTVLTSICSNSSLWDNYYLAEDLVESVIGLKEVFSFHSLSEIRSKYDDFCQDFVYNNYLFFDLMEVKVENVSGAIFFVPYNFPKKKIIITKKWLTDYLKDIVKPQVEEEVIDAYLNSEPEEDLSDLVTSMLHSLEEIEKVSDGGVNAYQIKYQYLSSVSSKIARIVFEKRIQLDHDDLREIEKEKIGVVESDMLPNKKRASEKYSWVQYIPGSGLVLYSDNDFKKTSYHSVRSAVQDFCEKHEQFYFNDIENFIKSFGYKYNYKSIRTYILSFCARSRTDNNLFLHRDKITDSNRDLWLQQKGYGTTNFIINKAVEYLQANNGELESSVLKEKIEESPEAVDFCVKYHSLDVIRRYWTNKDAKNAEITLFWKDVKSGKEYIILNQQVLDEGLYDLNKIGFIDKKPEYYSALIAMAISYLKKTEDNKCTISELQNECSEILNSENVTNGPFYKLFKDNNSLKKYTSELERCEDSDGNKWIRLKLETLKPESSYEIDKTSPVECDKNGEVAPTLVKVKEDRPLPTRRIDVDWDLLKKNFVEELGAYYGSKIWDLSTISFNEAVDKFMLVLANSRNNRMKSLISQDMFELWNYRIDKYDMQDFIMHLSTMYEGLIREIFILNNPNSHLPQTKGLETTMELMNKTKFFFSMAQDNNTTGFLKIMRDLKWRRNAFAHGVDLEMNTIQMVQTINNYIALYIYSVARFLS